MPMLTTEVSWKGKELVESQFQFGDLTYASASSKMNKSNCLWYRKMQKKAYRKKIIPGNVFTLSMRHSYMPAVAFKAKLVKHEGITVLSTA